MCFRYFANRLLVVLLSFIVATPLFAADGWYLLIPSRSEYDDRAAFLQGYEILDKKPLTQWGQRGAYDSARECEAVRDTLLKAEQNVYSKSLDAYLADIAAGKDPVILRKQRSMTEANNANVWAFIASRCISNSDTRLRP
jgi:hypothetical protein